MTKYLNTYIGFAEVPNEIALCINITNCPNLCIGCHSPHLRKDIGIELTKKEINKLIDSNTGISCVCFMGGDKSPLEIQELSEYTKSLNIKSAWYSGKKDLPEGLDINKFDYIKLGPYIEEYGPLNNIHTNQKFYTILNGEMVDTTFKFLKNN